MLDTNIGKELLSKDEKYVWHSMKPYNPNATLVVEKSGGARITDVDGKEYIDAMAGLFCVNVGYGRPELAQAAYEQLLKMPIHLFLKGMCLQLNWQKS